MFFWFLLPLHSPIPVCYCILNSNILKDFMFPFSGIHSKYEYKLRSFSPTLDCLVSARACFHCLWRLVTTPVLSQHLIPMLRHKRVCLPNFRYSIPLPSRVLSFALIEKHCQDLCPFASIMQDIRLDECYWALGLLRTWTLHCVHYFCHALKATPMKAVFPRLLSLWGYYCHHFLWMSLRVSSLTFWIVALPLILNF